MRKNILLILVISIILTGLMACSKTSDTDISSGQSKSSSGTEGTSNQTEIVKLVVAFPTWTGAPNDLAMIQEEMNKISREKIGVEVEFLVTDYASYTDQITLMLTGNEQLDIFSTLGGLYIQCIQKGQLLNLEGDDLLQTYGQGIIDAVGMEYIDACRVGGVLYGLPNNRDFAVGKGCFAVRTDLLEEVGYQFKNTGEIEHVTLDEVHEIFAKIHEAHPELEIIRPVAKDLTQFSPFDALGGNVFGVLMDYGSSLEVVNLFETDYYMEYCKRMYDYFKRGYISKDAATDSTPVGELVKAGTLAAYITGGKPGIKAQETKLCGQDMTILQTMDDFISSSAVASFPWAISYNCKDKVAAMKYLNLLYTDADMMNLITWGIENVHYVKKNDGHIGFPEGVDATNSGYLHSMNWLFPNQFLTHVWEGDSLTLWDEMQKFNSEARKSEALGFTFDTSKVATELTAVQNVYDEYQMSLEFGMTDPEVGVPEMNRKMKDAGLDAIIAEKQAQLDKWAAEMGKK